MAWTRLQSSRIEPFVNVGEEEVQSIIDRLQASKGQQEYRIAEIFLSSTPETAAETHVNAARIDQQLRTGESFILYPTQFSDASTQASGCDLGCVREAHIHLPLAAVDCPHPVRPSHIPFPLPG